MNILFLVIQAGLNEITEYEKMFFRAAARVQQETGVPIITHTQEGTMGPEQAELLVSHGADPARIMIGHMCGNTDVAYHARTLAHGVNLSFDRFGIQGIVGAPMDEMRIMTLAGLIGGGYADRIMLSHDSISVWLGRTLVMSDGLAQLLENWHLTHLFDNILPQLKAAGVTDESIHTMMVSNPSRLFGAETVGVESSAGKAQTL